MTDDLLTEWSRLLLRTFSATGVRDVVISPGSRSTPFTWAATEDPLLRCHSIIDERSAGFFALGQGRVTGEPSLLICTSGSAAANYFPAIVEAHESCTPLLVLTADRPFELQYCRALQTIDQTKLYGDFCPFFELGAPDSSPGAFRALHRLAAQTYALSRSPRPGPVHLNARAKKPLEPRRESASSLRTQVDNLLSVGPTALRREPPLARADVVEDLARSIAQARRPLIVCGALTPKEQVAPQDLEVVTLGGGVALFAEASSQVRFGHSLPPMLDALPWLLACPTFTNLYKADLVLELGAPLILGAWPSYLEGLAELRRHVVSPHDWSDPHGGATSIVQAAPKEVVNALATFFSRNEALARTSPERDRTRRWLAECNLAAWGIVDELLGEAGNAALSEVAAARLVSRQVPEGSLLMLGNSLPIRHVDAFSPAEARNLSVVFQRGTNGIDGLVSGAAGAAQAAGMATTLLLGDVSFLHDVGGLWSARNLATPLVLVVLNNGGGRIFEQLPLRVQELSAAVAKFWTTPHDLDLDHAARLYGARFYRATTHAELQAALRSSHDHRGTSIVEVKVPPSGAQDFYGRVIQRLDAALREIPEPPV